VTETVAQNVAVKSSDTNIVDQGDPIHFAHQHIYGNGVPKDEARGLQILEEAAAAGNAEAALKLGIRHFYGWGDLADATKARPLFERARELGHPEALYWIGKCHRDGIGVPKDRQMAYSVLEQAVTDGCARSMAAVALMMVVDKGRRSDWDRVWKLVRGSAAADDVDGVYLLGTMYASGWGCEPDPAAAIPWFRRAIDKGDDRAMYELAVLMEKGHGLQADIEGAFDLYAAAEKKGNRQAKERIDRALDLDEWPSFEETLAAERVRGLSPKYDGPKDDDAFPSMEDFSFEDFPFEDFTDFALPRKPRAGVSSLPSATSRSEAATSSDPLLDWKTSLAEGGDVEAQAYLGLHYKYKDPNPERSNHWLERAAEGGSAEAQASLGLDHMGGFNGRPRNRELGLEWVHKGAHGGDAMAQSLLGWEYLHDPTMRNTETALFWLERAVRQGHAPSMTVLGRCYMQGMSKDFSHDDGLKLIIKAAELGDASAKEELEGIYRERGTVH